MEIDKIDALFRDFEGDFDVELPEIGHQQRFSDKLNAVNSLHIGTAPKRKYYKAILAVAASLVLCFGLLIFLDNQTEVNDLASVSPEFSQTQDFFTTAITTELIKIQAQRSPENDVLISDALKQIELLEKNYERLKIDLKESGNDKRVIYAMISNFQSRINLLENLLEAIENLKNMTSTEPQQMTL